MAGYRLSRRAEGDLLDISVYGIETFGVSQAERYHRHMARCFELMAEQPRTGREATTIAECVRRHEHGSHVVLYEATSDGVLILAIIHNRSIRRLKI